MKKTLLASLVGISTLAVLICFTSAKKYAPFGTDLIEDIPTVQAFFSCD